MEFSELFVTHIATDIDSYFDKKYQFPGGIKNISFEVTINDIEATSKLLRLLSFGDKRISFTLTILFKEKQNTEIDKNWFSCLLSLLSNSGYFKTKGYHVVFLNILFDTKENQGNDLTILLSKLESVGFNKILMIELAKEAQDRFLSVFQLNSLPNFEEIPSFLLQTQKSFHLYTNAAEIIHRPELLSNYKQKISALNESDKRFIILYNRLNEKLDKDEATIDFLTESIRSKEDYLEFLLYAPSENGIGGLPPLSEYQKIKKFYHNEYEILPLWYKRFGHVIKVIVGKRSLKSLFSDNVKKYKE